MSSTGHPPPALRRWRAPGSAALGIPALAAVIAFAPAPATAQIYYAGVSTPVADTGGITASGSAEVLVPAGSGQLYVTFAVERREGGGALDSVTALRDRALEALASLDLGPEAVTLLGAGVTDAAAEPRPFRQPDGPAARIGRMTLRVVIASLEELDEVLATVSALDPETVRLALDPGGTEDARREAVRRAVAEARAQAEASAEALGVRLGPLRSVLTAPHPGDALYREMFLNPYAGGGAMPLSPLRVGVLVHATWEIASPR